MVEWYGIPFRWVPVGTEPAAKEAAFDELSRIVDEERTDVVVLARYMQILPPAMCAARPGGIINIHHSFLPSFAGARPYQQAFDRGVKLIGATCHYVTADLDEGPIIEQDTRRIDHADSPDGAAPGRARHRAHGAGPRGALAPRGPGAAQRQQDRRLHLSTSAEWGRCSDPRHRPPVPTSRHRRALRPLR